MMRKVIGIVVSLLASAGWIWIAYGLGVSFKQQIPITVNQVIVALLSCFIVALMLAVDAIERTVG